MHELSQHESLTAECDEQDFPPPPLQGKQQNDNSYFVDKHGLKSFLGDVFRWKTTSRGTLTATE